jgi:hypothetical protein
MTNKNSFKQLYIDKHPDQSKFQVCMSKNKKVGKIILKISKLGQLISKFNSAFGSNFMSVHQTA